MVSIDTSEVTRLAADLTKAGPLVAKKASMALRKTAYDIERDAKILCPVDTGALRGSISTTAAALYAEIGPTMSYSSYVEFGTSRMAPEPYMRPAAARNIPGLVRAFEDIGGEIL